MHVRSLGWEETLEEGMQPAPVNVSGESRGQRSLARYSPQGPKPSDTPEVAQRAAAPSPGRLLPTGAPASVQGCAHFSLPLQPWFLVECLTMAILTGVR